MTDQATPDGFDAGERQAFKDQRNGVRRGFADDQQSDYQRGYRDGYTPRNPSWWRSLAPAQFWWSRETDV